jgi:hypothetical protein
LAILTTGTSLFLFMYKDFEMHGWALMLIPPALYADFQALLMILNPFALIYKDKFEIKKHLLNEKTWYFNDIKKVGEIHKSGFSITYNDDEIENIKLNGIRQSHINAFREALHKKVFLSLENRDKQA